MLGTASRVSSAHRACASANSPSARRIAPSAVPADTLGRGFQLGSSCRTWSRISRAASPVILSCVSCAGKAVQVSPRLLVGLDGACATRTYSSLAPSSRAGAPTPLATLVPRRLPLPPPSSTHWPPSESPLGARAWSERYFCETTGALLSVARSGGGSSRGAYPTALLLARLRQDALLV